MPPKRHRRRKKRGPLSPEAHAAILAEQMARLARKRALKAQWAVEDASYRQAAQLEGKRRNGLRNAARQNCARELTRKQT